MRVTANAAPFDIRYEPPVTSRAPRRGVLCIHGFTGTPFEMRYLGQALHQRGMSVLGPQLAAHGTSAAELNDSTWTQWYASVLDAFDALAARVDQIAVVGQSLGGLLALHLARERGEKLAALATLATPLWLPPAARLATNALTHTWLGRLVPMVPKRGGSDIRDPRMRARNPAYEVIPVRALGQLHQFMARVRQNLRSVRPPTLVIHARRDHTVPYTCSLALVDQLGADVIEHHPLVGSYHLVAIDIERDLVADAVGAFFEHQFKSALDRGREVASFATHGRSMSCDIARHAPASLNVSETASS